MLLNRLGWVTVRHSRLTLLLAVLGIVVAGVIGAGVIDKLTTGGFVSPSSESENARLTLLKEFEQGPPNVVVLVTATNGTSDSPDVAAAGTELTRKLADEPGVEQVWSYWSPGSPPPLRSADGHSALLFARIGGSADDVQQTIKTLSPAFTTTGPIVTTQVGGTAEVARQSQEQIRGDLEFAEMISLPALLILLVLVFGGVVAAGLPFAIGAISVVGTLLVLRILTALTDVSLFAMNLTTALGLGLAIDYGLFIVARYREERRRGLQHPDAVVRSVETAGRTVLFSAATVAASLSALLVFPTTFLRSFAYAGIAVVALSALGAIVVLPALLAVAGPHMDRFPIFRRAIEGRHRIPKPGAWRRLALAVMKRPIVTGGAVVALLLALGAPFLGVRFELPDHRVLPTDTSSRQVQETIDRDFARGEGSNLIVVAKGPDAANTSADVIAAYATELSGIAGVARVDAATGSYANGASISGAPQDVASFLNGVGTWLSIVPAVEPLSPDGERLVDDVRSAPRPFPVEVGGASAVLVDTKSALFSRLPVAVGLIALITFIVLFLFTGGVLLPLKGLVLNLLSLTATFGAMVWIFQDGRFADQLGFTPTGSLDANMPILMFCVAFGLSMDYEVFLLSRIKERYDLTGDNEEAVAYGLENTGRLITTAAAMLGIVFLAFGTSGITFIKLMGFGTALAVMMDATLVRGVLVPAFMRLAGDANWWAPGWLRAVHRRIGLKESDWSSADAEQPAPVLTKKTGQHRTSVTPDGNHAEIGSEAVDRARTVTSADGVGSR